MTTIASRPWDGSHVRAGDAGYTVLALLTTEVASPGTAPTPVIAAASDGRGVWVVPPARLGPFLRAHADANLVCHDAGELHRVLRDHLRGADDPEAQRLLWQFAATGRLSDVGLLDQLDRLAENGASHPRRLSLRQLAQQHADLALRGEDELPRVMESGSDSDVAAEVSRRADAVVRVFHVLWRRAHTGRPGSSASALGGRSGPLSLALQVKGDVALAQARHNGLRLAPGAVKRINEACESSLARSAGRLRTESDFSAWLKRTLADRAPSQDPGRTGQLRSWLARVADSARCLHQTEMLPPLCDDGRPSDAPEAWGDLGRADGLLRAWSDLLTALEIARSCALGGFCHVRPAYDVLPRLHSSAPDLDALRRLAGIGLFAAAPGHALVALRLQDLRLRSLAAVCRARVGNSALAELFARRHDRIAYAAAALAGCPEAELAALGQQHPEKQDRSLRAARALLQAAPAGLSVDRAAEVVREEFALPEVGRAQVAAWHAQLIGEIFGELSAFLRDDTVEVMAANIRATVEYVRVLLDHNFGPALPLPQLRKWYRRYHGQRGRLKDCLRALLENCGTCPALNAALRKGLSDHQLYLALFARDVVSLSGRARGRLPFAQARAADYLDLADDAAKSALFRVAAAGHKVVGYADATIVIELPSAADAADRADEASELARHGAEDVLRDVPAKCSAEVLHHPGFPR
jgi:hypothetical protein